MLFRSRYYNDKYSRSGTLWSSRYKSSLVESEKFLFDVMAYIESSSDRAKIIDYKKYPYSSLSKNLYYKPNLVVTFNNKYKQLAYTDKERSEKYGRILSEKINNVELMNFISDSIERQNPIATKDFLKTFEMTNGVLVSSVKRGRPKKYNNQGRHSMYKNLVVLDKQKHKDLKIKSLQNLFFAKDLNFVPILSGEIERVATLFPVVFTSDENPTLISLVSLGNSGSLAINNSGKWISNYVPSFIRRYPFSLATNKEDMVQKIILIDEDSELFSVNDGLALFDENNQKTDALQKAIDFLTSYDHQSKITQQIVQTIAQSGILEDREITVGEGEEQKVLIKGFKVIDQEKLYALSDDVLATWVRQGIMPVVDMHLKSLSNIQNLFTLLSQRQL